MTVKRFALLSLTAASLLIPASEARALGHPQPAPSWTSYGLSLFATGPDVWVKFFGGDAEYSSSLFYICGVGSSCEQLLYKNTNGPRNNQVKLDHTFAIGEEVLFKLFIGNTNDAWYTGPASNNDDNAVHFATAVINDETNRATYSTVGGFEDLRGSGDHDYNDVMFEFANVSTTAPVTATPEPATIVLMATGLCAVGLFARKRRRRATENS
jgi:PEP-CTERM putative exosortase interaction domain